MTDRSIVVRLRADVTDYIRSLNQAGTRTREASQQLGGYVQANSAHISSLSNTVGLVGAAMVGVATLAVKKFADFDAAMSNVAATGDDARGSMDELRQAALDAGAATAFSATEAAGGIENLAKAGLSSADILGGALTGSLDLAAAGTLDVADAAEIAATTLSQFGLEGSDTAHVADLLAAGAGKAQGEVADMAQALKQGGLVAAQFGLTVEETVGTLAAFAKAGLVGSDAGTSLKTMLLKLGNPSKEAAAEMERLHIAAYDLATGEFVGIAALADQLKASLEPLPQAERDAALATIFGSDAIRAANVLMKEGAAGIDQWVAAVDDQGFAADVARIKLDNLKGDLEALGGSFETALIGMGEGANGPLRELVQGATDVVNAFGQMPESAQQAVLGIVGGGGLVLLGIAGLGKLVVAIGDVKLALTTMGVSAKVAGLAVASVGGLIAIGTLALTAWANSIADAKARTEGYLSTLDKLGNHTDATLSKINDALTANRTNTLESMFGKDPESLIDKFDKIGVSVEEMQGYILGTGDAVEAVQGKIDTYMESFEGSDYDFRKEKDSIDGLVDALDAEAKSLTEAEKQAGQKAVADEAMTGTTEAATAAVEAQAAMTEEAAKALEQWRETVGSADESFVVLGDAYGAVLERMTEAERAKAQNTADTNDVAEDSWEDYFGTVTVSSADYIAELQAQVTAQENWESNMLEISKRVAQGMSGDMKTAGEQMIDELLTLGPEGAAQVELLKNMSDAEFAQVITLWQNKGATAVSEFTSQVEAYRQPVITVDANVDPAQVDVNSFITYNNGRRVNVIVDAVGGATYSVANSGVSYFAEGGPVYGPGAPTSDSIPARLSTGEYVINAAAVSQYGKGLFDNLNRRRFADGGEVSAWPSSASTGQYAAPPPAAVTIEGAHMTGTLDMGNGLVGVIDARVARGFAAAARAGAGTRSSAGRVR